MKTKICNKCGVEQPIENYSFRKERNKHIGTCRKCKNARQRLLNKNKLEYKRIKSREWYQKNKERKKYTQKLWREKNKETERERLRKSYLKNLNKIKERRLKNIDVVNYKMNLYNKRRRSKDIKYKITMNLRSRINTALKNQYGLKSIATIEILGCTIPELKTYLESKFKSGMTWKNYGVHGWHIDHIIPCASFDLTDPEQQRKCFNYKNLQPLWWKDNISKGCRIIMEA